MDIDERASGALEDQQKALQTSHDAEQQLNIDESNMLIVPEAAHHRKIYYD